MPNFLFRSYALRHSSPHVPDATNLAARSVPSSLHPSTHDTGCSRRPSCAEGLHGPPQRKADFYAPGGPALSGLPLLPAASQRQGCGPSTMPCAGESCGNEQARSNEAAFHAALTGCSTRLTNYVHGTQSIPRLASITELRSDAQLTSRTRHPEHPHPPQPPGDLQCTVDCFARPMTPPTFSNSNQRSTTGREYSHASQLTIRQCYTANR